MNKKLSAVACGAAVLTLGLTGCGASFEGTGSKDAASAEQLAMRTDDPWAAEIVVDPAARSAEPLRDGLYTGSTLLVQDGRISCVSLTQDGETQSVGGFEAVRDGKYALMIEAAQGSDIDTVSGATITTEAVRNAVDDALDQARVETASSQPAGAGN